MRRNESIYFKNFITIVLVLAVSFIVLGTSFAGLSYNYIMREQTRTMEKNAEEAGKMVSSYAEIWEIDGLEVRAMLMWIAETSGFQILVTDEAGTVVSCSDRDIFSPVLGSVVPAEVIASIETAGEYNRFSDLGGIYAARRYVVGTALRQNQRGSSYKGYIFLSGEMGEMSEIWRRFAGIFVVVAIVVVAISFVASYITMKKQAAPLDEMAQAAHRFGRGDFSVRVTETGRQDEIGELAYAFNKMADSLENSEKARRELIANVSHELKTPMTTITGFADGILDGTIPPEKEKEYMAVISSETKRLSRLVRGMLDMSQLQSAGAGELSKKSFDISEVMRLALVSLESKITERGLDVDARLPEEAVMTLGDMDSITQVVYNLIDNAAKFASPGSTIKLELWKQDDKAYVSVENTGETISKEELPLIFDRFHKTDRSRSMDKDGVGLGLYIVKTILDSHGEDIFVTSEDGVTTFTFTLTLAV